MSPESRPNISPNPIFSERLRDLRRREGYTLRKIADILGVSHTYLLRVENGVNNAPLRASFYERMHNVPGWSEEDVTTLLLSEGSRSSDKLSLRTDPQDKDYRTSYASVDGLTISLSVRGDPKRYTGFEVNAVRRMVREEVTVFLDDYVRQRKERTERLSALFNPSSAQTTDVIGY